MTIMCSKDCPLLWCYGIVYIHSIGNILSLKRVYLSSVHPRDPRPVLPKFMAWGQMDEELNDHLLVLHCTDCLVFQEFAEVESGWQESRDEAGSWEQRGRNWEVAKGC
ncbi:hypothetical protein KUCAC02_012547 [Chaenocephalus aceratus]|uniref:Uncharacterized protein n=1 Tax=Chaenocephalus aceratus TaxID=36190 RepID=A0ACB9XAW5_CHAAC|nr:hypothetical protein KUCAC02_012547 [Chaenocephalus aceratus]